VGRPTLSSSPLLRGARFEDAPLVIDTAYELPVQEDVTLADELMEEYPDTEPEEIEDAIQEAIDTLMTGPDPEAQVSGLSDDLIDADLGPETWDGGPEDGSPIITPPPVPAVPAVDTEALLREARQQAAQMADQAKGEAAAVLADADGRAAEIERAAYDRGYNEGLSGGKTAGEDQAAEMIQQVTAIVDRATQLHDTMLQEAEAEMVALCLEIARKIIQAELRTNPDVVKSVVAAAVQKINGSPRVTIKVNPGQVDLVQAHWLHAFGPNYRDKEWVIEGEEAIQAGGCRLETKYGQLDAQIGGQFAEIQKTFALLLGTA